MGRKKFNMDPKKVREKPNGKPAPNLHSVLWLGFCVLIGCVPSIRGSGF
jgi:hypothetical protein